jgi:hypothetical protein
MSVPVMSVVARTSAAERSAVPDNGSGTEEGLIDE